LAVLGVALLVPALAFAWPVDMAFDVPEGGHHFQRVAPIGWVETEDPSIATAEVLPSGEVLIEGKAVGSTLLLAEAEGKFAVWRIRVVGKSERAQPKPAQGAAWEAARKACPGMAEGDGEGPKLRVTVKDESCRRALRTLFEGDAYLARDLELVFEVPALQAQLGAMEQALKAAKLEGLHARYVGAGLVLTGTATEAEFRRALLLLFRQAVGRVSLEDRVERSGSASH
jgi:hypothetical protein